MASWKHVRTVPETKGDIFNIISGVRNHTDKVKYPNFKMFCKQAHK